MLNIYLNGFPKDCIKDPNSFFDMYKKDSWMENPYVKKYIKEIDKSEVLKGGIINSPLFGLMSPDRLSSGCKCLILMECYPNSNVYATRCGDNCAKFIADISRRKNLSITLHHMMPFGEDFDFKIMDTGFVGHTYREMEEQFINFFYGN